jgi:predicted DNA-binding transcriptional regulator AlpA
MSTYQTPLDGLEQLISIDELSECLGVPVKTIYDWRLSGHGPCAICVGRHLNYAVSDVRVWLANQRENVPRQRAGGE